MPKSRYKTYRDLLREEFERRQSERPRYSLRAFAKHLGMNPSFLSQVMKGRAGLSRTLATRISTKLELNAELSEFFCNSAAALHGRSQVERAVAEARIKKRVPVFKDLPLASFELLGDWRHFVLLELVAMKRFGFTPDKASKVLRWSTTDIRALLQRLESAGFVEQRDGVYHNTEPSVSFPEGVPSPVVRRYHREMLKLAHDAIEAQPIDSRVNASTVMGIDASRIPEIRREIQEFHARICRDYGSSTDLPGIFVPLARFKVSSQV